jgi:hypothetical protein
MELLLGLPISFRFLLGLATELLLGCPRRHRFRRTYGHRPQFGLYSAVFLVEGITRLGG